MPTEVMQKKTFIFEKENAMKLNYSTLKNKILGCFNGKNAGGVLGAPFEPCKRGIHDVNFYVQKDLNRNPPPNDDLDLQLVWLVAAEKYGSRINSHILAEYWNTFITPDWAEYGAGKRNLAQGMLPPLSGSVANIYKDSNGAWIRTEIWACLAAGHPEIAVRYALEDAWVDHADEGVFATAFCAALESAAFAESDVYTLLDIAESYLPESSACRDNVEIAKQAYRDGEDWQSCRRRLLLAHSSSFGVAHTKLREIDDEFVGSEKVGFDAPFSVGVIALSLLYGEGDFAKTVCLATNCGEDTDCTAGTVGAAFGAIYGNDALPEKWMAPIGGVINTCCIELTGGIKSSIPKTTEEVTNRIIRCMPAFLPPKYLDVTDGIYSLDTAESLACPPECEYVPEVLGHKKENALPIPTLLKLSPYAVRYEFFNVGVILEYEREPFVKQGDSFNLTLYFHDLMDGSVRGHFANVKIHADEGVNLPLGNYISAPIQTTYTTKTKITVPVTVERFISPKADIIFDISINGRPTAALVKATLYPYTHEFVCAKRP